MPAPQEPIGLLSFQGLFQSAFAGMDNVALACEPAVRSTARCQLEAMGLMSRRAQAYMELPSRLSQCRTPQDLISEQNRFWQDAFQQYSDSSRRMLAAWSQVFAMPSPFAPVEKKASRPRDVIAVPESKPAAAESARLRAVGGRRVA